MALNISAKIIISKILNGSLLSSELDKALIWLLAISENGNLAKILTYCSLLIHPKFTQHYFNSLRYSLPFSTSSFAHSVLLWNSFQPFKSIPNAPSYLKLNQVTVSDKIFLLLLNSSNPLHLSCDIDHILPYTNIYIKIQTVKFVPVILPLDYKILKVKYCIFPQLIFNMHSPRRWNNSWSFSPWS